MGDPWVGSDLCEPCFGDLSNDLYNRAPCGLGTRIRPERKRLVPGELG